MEGWVYGWLSIISSLRVRGYRYTYWCWRMCVIWSMEIGMKYSGAFCSLVEVQYGQEWGTCIVIRWLSSDMHMGMSIFLVTKFVCSAMVRYILRWIRGLCLRANKFVSDVHLCMRRDSGRRCGKLWYEVCFVWFNLAGNYLNGVEADMLEYSLYMDGLEEMWKMYEFLFN